MGEVLEPKEVIEPKVEPVVISKLDMGTEAIAQESVVVPTEEKLIGFNIEQTKDGSWSRFDIRTCCRTVSVEPGIIGEEAFDNLCGLVKAMYDTTEGAAVISALRNVVKGKPLSLRVSLIEGTVK